jgi:hypothetical protein
MTIDYSALLYDPVYAEIGVEAVLRAGTAAEDIPITVIDDTRPKSTAGASLARMSQDMVDVHSVGPGAFARIPELAGKGIARDDYRDAVLTFNGRTWVVLSYELRGSPNGEDFGEVRFRLKEVAPT